MPRGTDAPANQASVLAHRHEARTDATPRGLGSAVCRGSCSVTDSQVRGGVRSQLTSLEWPGNRCASGSSATAMLLTAVAASPKPVAISLTLPGYAAMSPAA